MSTAGLELVSSEPTGVAGTVVLRSYSPACVVSYRGSSLHITLRPTPTACKCIQVLADDTDIIRSFGILLLGLHATRTINDRTRASWGTLNVFTPIPFEQVPVPCVLWEIGSCQNVTNR